jgi:hypothetical protein
VEKSDCRCNKFAYFRALRPLRLRSFMPLAKFRPLHGEIGYPRLNGSFLLHFVQSSHEEVNSVISGFYMPSTKWLQYADR